ncbi:MAG: hypothetical protein R2844_21500 [Caldilineales bacterium]
MESLTNIWSIALLFVLRLGVPVLLTVGLGLLLKRLDARWQAEAREQRNAMEAATPAKPSDRPKPVGQRTTQPLVALSGIGAQPCWAVKGCTDSMRAACAASHQPNVPCWQARTIAEGRLPSECKACDLHIPAPYVMAESRVLH